MRAVLVRRAFEASRRRFDPDPIFADDEVLFEGDLPDAIEAAKAVPATERLLVSLETGQGTFAPDDFDRLTPDSSPFRDLDLAHGGLTVRVKSSVFEALRGDRPHPIPPMMLITDHLDRLNAIVRRQIAAGFIEVEGGKRILTITASDL